MIYIMHYRDQDSPRKVQEDEAKALIVNNWDNPQMQEHRWERLQAGEQVHLRNGYLMRGGGALTPGNEDDELVAMVALLRSKSAGNLLRSSIRSTLLTGQRMN